MASSWWGPTPIQTPSQPAPSAPPALLNMGSPIPIMCAKTLSTFLLTALVIASTETLQETYNSFRINTAPIKIVAICVLVLAVSMSFGDIYSTWENPFYVEDGMLCGIDLWTVTHVEYGHHWLSINNRRFVNIPNARVLYESLEDYYIQLTGEPLP